uniref:ADF-H domain-containing protein n=1 Tax=Steinernema glaseri TaxID=37863 RepID=A0A1I7Y2G8_9BILA
MSHDPNAHPFRIYVQWTSTDITALLTTASPE